MCHLKQSADLFFKTCPDNLNPAQWEAVVYQGGHLLIVAGPGTGKTHTIMYRILHLTPHISETQKILAITFTNKAARQMHDRLSVHNTKIFDYVTVGTFHSFCQGVLREYGDGFSEFEILRPEDSLTIASELWPDLKGRALRSRLDGISKWKAIQFEEEMPEHIEYYNRHLRSLNLLDFDDLLLETILLLEKNASILSDLQLMYRYIFVDEYQDINPIQHCLLKLLMGTNNVITAIGDPHQAIYGFRGSDVSFFDSFIQDFKDASVLSLQENYRSAKNLLSASAQVISSHKKRGEVDLIAKMYDQGRLVIHQASTDKAEAEFVVHQIEKMIGGISLFSQDSGRVGNDDLDDRSFGDIVVLYRLKSQRNALKTALDRSGIPYYIEGAEKETEDVICPHPAEESGVDVEKVSLMTLHASKGLEFPVVFIVGCEEKVLPLNLDGLDSSVDEERRLFYVGMTRAKERLFLVHAQKRFLYGKRYEFAPSRFLSDIQDDLKEYELTKSLKKKKKDDQLSLFE